MCDTLVAVLPDGVLFAKNSDRPPSEAQVLDWQPAADHPPGSVVACTHMRIPQARHTYAVLLSRPTWMWGAEIATNEHGVTIGNEAVFSRFSVPGHGLTGMDLLRLAVERADTAERAASVIVDLGNEFGQGGDGFCEQPAFRYFSSFLIADRARAFVLETAGPHHAIEEVHGARSISNGLTIPDFADRYSDFLKTWASGCRLRRPLTEKRAWTASGLSDLASALRDHGSGFAQQPEYHPLLGTMHSPCMHAGGLIVHSQTTASWIARLSASSASESVFGGDRHFVTGTAAPCTALFKPVSVHEPISKELLGAPAHGQADAESLFWRHERLHRLVMRHPTQLLSLYEEERNALEAAWFSAPPSSEQAFRTSLKLLEKWTELVWDKLCKQPTMPRQRPRWVDVYWGRQNRKDRLSYPRG